MRAAAVQLNSNEDKARNLEIAERLVRDAPPRARSCRAAGEVQRARLTRADLLAGAEPLDGPTLRWASVACARARLWLVAGSIVERVEGDDKLRNTSVLIGPDGAIARGLPQDPHVRRRSRRHDLPRVRRRRRPATRSSSRSGRAEARAGGLLRPSLSRSSSGSWRCAARGRSRCLGVHRADRPGALGGARARPRDREPGVRDRGRPGRAAIRPTTRATGTR